MANHIWTFKKQRTSRCTSCASRN